MRKKEKPTQERKREKKEKPVKEKKTRNPREKKPHDEGYVVKKNTGMKVLRIILWMMLIFIFVRGIVTILKPDKEEEVARLIREFKADYSDFSNQNNEIMAFAQNFAREYLTYEVKGEDDYKVRLAPYVSANFLNASVNDFKGTASAVYVQAYRVEDYSDAQKDVYVLAEVEYSSRKLDADGQTYVTESKKDYITLCVPVYISKEQTYVVENIPLMVSDSISAEYTVQDYYGSALEESKVVAVKTAVENFLKAYYEQDESVLNYYLAAEADRQKFQCLQGRFSFEGIDSLKCYQDESGDIICLVEFKIQDINNEVKLLQKINLSIRESGGKYYIESMGTRTGNFNNK